MSRTVVPGSMAITLVALVGVSLAVLCPGWRGELRALGYYPVIVVLNGDLTLFEGPPELSLRLTAQVSSGKTPESGLLFGNGHTSVLHGAGKPDKSAAQFELQGLVNAEGIVHLTGEVVRSNDPALIGQLISITASEQSGDIIMTFGSITLAGNGKVMIR